MKVLGAEIVEFFNSKWPDELYVDDCEMSVDGDRIVQGDSENSLSYPLDEKYELSTFGYLCSTAGFDAKVPSLASFFKKWKQDKTTVTLVLQVDKDKEAEVRAALEGLGVKVQG